MSQPPLIIVGISGFGRETADVATAAGHPILGFLDDRPSPEDLDRLARLGHQYLGTVDEWLAGSPEPTCYVIGIASGRAKEIISTKLDAAGHIPTTVIHPTVTFGADTKIGRGGVYCAGARVTTNVTLGDHVNLNLNCTVGHDSVLNFGVSLNPTANIAGNVVVGARTLVGVGANVLQNLTVGEDVTVGASAVVTKDVPNGVIVKGIPGRW